MGAFLQRYSQPLGGEFEHHAAHLRGAVFERKIIVAAGGAGQVGHFARYPQAGKTALQQLARQRVKFGHRQRGGGKQFGHGALRKKSAIIARCLFFRQPESRGRAFFRLPERLDSGLRRQRCADLLPSVPIYRINRA